MNREKYVEKINCIIKQILDEFNLEYDYNDGIFLVTKNINCGTGYRFETISLENTVLIIFSNVLFIDNKTDEFVNVSMALNKQSVLEETSAVEIVSIDEDSKRLAVWVTQLLHIVSEFGEPIDIGFIRVQVHCFFNKCKELDNKLKKLVLEEISYKDF